MDVAAYLDRIGYRGATEPTVDVLVALHEAHLRAVPFENLSIHTGERIELDAEWLFDKIVTRRRGGFCYELNGLFAALLDALGFAVASLAARVARADGSLGIPFDHMTLRVQAGGESWLADVGFGDCFRRPLRLFATESQSDGVREYRIERRDDDGRDLLERQGDTWKPQYRFELQPYALAEFSPGCDYHQTSPDSHFTQRRVCSLATADGRITLRDDRLIISAGDEKREQPIDPDAWTDLLAEHFGIAL